MKSFIEYKEDIYKCSKCGLCQAVCPVYKATKNECVLSRGKFTILNGVLENKLELNKNVVKNFDLCLNCNACKNFCPSDIDAKEVFASLKNEFNSKNKRLSRILYSSCFFEIKMNLIKTFTFMYHFLQFDKIIKILTPFILKMGVFGKRIVFLNSILKITTKRRRGIKPSVNKGKVVFFEGCFNKYINPSSKNATKNLIESLGFEIVNINLKCCGVSSYYSGHFKEFQKQADLIIKSVPEDIEAVICDCATCLSVLKSYKNIFLNADDISEKTISVVEFLEKNNYSKTFNKKYKLSYHKPCHDEHDNESFIKGLANIEFFPLEVKNECCGFSGEFAIKHQSISREISKSKAENIAKTGADIVVTTCPSCVMGLNQGLLEIKQTTIIMNVSELLNID